MDWTALSISVNLALWTCALSLPLGLGLARALAWRRFRLKGFCEAAIALPLVLPPTVLGYYLLVGLGPDTALGGLLASVAGQPLVFSFAGLVVASIIFNLPFAVQPMQRALEAIPANLREAAWCSGLGSWQTFWRIELPLAWQGILSAMVLVFAHTLGEFGVVLMVGGNIPGETQTIAISIYDRVQALDDGSAAAMSAFLLLFSFGAIGIIYMTSGGHRPAR